jgi:hypothetical protein
VDKLTARQPLDQDGVSDLMRCTMQVGEDTGWHNGADVAGGYFAYLVYDTYDVVTASKIERILRSRGAPIRSSRYAAQPVLGPDLFSPEQAMAAGIDSPAAAFDNFAMNVGFADLEAVDRQTQPGGLRAFREFLRQPGVLGFMVISEAWGMRHPGPAAAALLESGIHPGRIKGAEETRRIFFCDIHDQVSRAYKWRGEPDIEIEHGVHICDQLVISVRILADVASGRPLPDSQEAFTARYHGDCGAPHEG